MAKNLPNIAPLRVGNDGQIPPDGGNIEFLFETSTTQTHQIGQRLCLSNGAVFRYAYLPTAVARQTLVGAATPISGHFGGLTLGSSATASGGGNTGDMTVKIQCSATAITKNQYQGGQYVIASHSGGLGSTQVCWIKDHPAALASAVCELNLYNPLQFPVDSRCKGNLIHNPYYNCVVLTTGAENYPVGMTCTTVAATSYTWLQTWGPTGALCSPTFPVLGGQVTCGSHNTGAVSSGGSTAYYPQIGFGGNTSGADAQLMAIFLTISP